MVMGRILLGSLAAAAAMFVIGMLFFATPLSRIHVADLDDARAAAVQQALAANLPDTATYNVPGMQTAAQTAMYGRGPIATVHYNSRGFASGDVSALAGGFVLDLVVALLIGTALLGIGTADRAPFADRARVATLFALAFSAFMHLDEPIWYHHDWGHFLYLFVADAAALTAAGLILSRWFLPGADRVSPAAPGG